MQVAILLVSVSGTDSLSSKVFEIKIMDPDKATWDYVSARLIEEMRSQKLVDGVELIASSPTVATARTGRDLSNLKCYRCRKRGHFARDYKAKPKNRRQKEEENVTVLAALAGCNLEDY